ncbi:hypothetical protein BXZ70DRAFT_905260 [Cristinia sonorae]|uniref:AB hydrolase-1 domain-containing protein n=1 Tax=Cristinia sonorae TaxID=1940300 RepID=A0A8K0XS23_9AGAR|nr:hypothetical protein BXZ70DRAFT_905260 [Cristinia sonorae]
MPDLKMVKYGLFAIHDTGAPAGRDDYTTLIMLHGLVWHSGIFGRMPQFAAKHGARLVLMNRRDYPHTSPYTEEELKPLHAGASASFESAHSLREYVRCRGRDLYDFLQEFIVAERIPLKGGIILAAWSFGVVFTTSLLANAPSFSRSGDVNVALYLRCVLNYAPPSHVLGYSYLPGGYNPLVDETIPTEERAKRFQGWVTGHYHHGESLSTLELRTPLSEPKPTIETMTSEEIASSLDAAPGRPDGSDELLRNAGVQLGLFEELRLRAYFPSETSSSEWDDVKLRYVWCDQAAGEAVYTKYRLEAEFEAAEKAGRKRRSLEMTRVRGTNHFFHWSQPERALLVFLGDGNAADALDYPVQ